MEKRLLSRSWALILAVFMCIPIPAQAQDSTFDRYIQELHASRLQMEAQLGLNPELDPYPQATGYCDDLVVHYEQAQVMRDVIDEGILF
ncbi:MAG: hypothetical protein KGK03_09635 [Candidatus Omnitrophica bacterium]|nr:hypothetical protein [Candidatus Omnitrophota bacterium]MDE2223314.1 hypothetical protein [Candidatus Omnitrophota bacterium]